MGTYITQSDVEAFFGARNVAEWSNRANDGSGASTSVIASAIAYAESYVEDRFRGGPYTVPFQALSGTLYVVNDWCVKIAGHRLYSGRPPGVKDNDRLADMLEEVEANMQFYLAGTRRLNAARGTENPTGMNVSGAD